MSDIITLKDGRREWIGKPGDFSAILEKELGLDAREYFNAILDECDFEIKETSAALRCMADEALDEVCERLSCCPPEIGQSKEVMEIMEWIKQTQEMRFSGG